MTGKAVLAILWLEMEDSMARSPRLQETTAGGSLGGILKTLGGVGADALTHGILGSALAVFAAGTLILALLCEAASVTVVGILAFLATVGAATNGVPFHGERFSQRRHLGGNGERVPSRFHLLFHPGVHPLGQGADTESPIAAAVPTAVVEGHYGLRASAALRLVSGTAAA